MAAHFKITHCITLKCFYSMKLQRTKEGMEVMSKDRLTKDSDFSEPIHVECDEGCEASVEQLRLEACQTISERDIPVEDADIGYYHEDIAIGEDLYKEINFYIKPKEGGSK